MIYCIHKIYSAEWCEDARKGDALKSMKHENETIRESENG